jgi:hypothetical protein
MGAFNGPWFLAGKAVEVLVGMPQPGSGHVFLEVGDR